MKTDLTTEGTENTEGEGTTNQTNLTNQEKMIGLVGPMSNDVPPQQWVENVPYKGFIAAVNRGRRQFPFGSVFNPCSSVAQEFPRQRAKRSLTIDRAGRS